MLCISVQHLCKPLVSHCVTLKSGMFISNIDPLFNFYVQDSEVVLDQ